jgi:superfamily II DNA/RNA helicase
MSDANAPATIPAPSPAGFYGLAGLEVTPELAAALADNGITEPTPVQAAAIPRIIEGAHVIAQAGTGTGKTLAYLLPVLQRLRREPKSRAAIYAPAPDLAMQILRVARLFAKDIKAGALVASQSLRGQREDVQQSTQLIVGTPGRILEQYARKKLKGVNIVVLDEPDPILATEQAPFLREVLLRPEPKIQLIMVTATLGPRAESLAAAVTKDQAVRIVIEQGPLVTQIAHRFINVSENAGKDVRLARFIQENHCDRAIVFVNEDRLVRHVFRFLQEQGLTPVSLSQDRPKQERHRAVAAFAESKARVLITNDAAARGLDIPDVRWVLHYDLPFTSEAYLHRAGRTGRAGKRGTSVVLRSEANRAALKRLTTELGIEFLPFETER